MVTHQGKPGSVVCVVGTPVVDRWRLHAKMMGHLGLKDLMPPKGARNKFPIFF